MFWVISVYFNIRNTLPKSGTFLLGHSVYIQLAPHSVHHRALPVEKPICEFSQGQRVLLRLISHAPLCGVTTVPDTDTQVACCRPCLLLAKQSESQFNIGHSRGSCDRFVLLQWLKSKDIPSDQQRVPLLSPSGCRPVSPEEFHKA